MSRGHETIKARFAFFDKLRLFLMEHGQVTAMQIAKEFDITDRQAREYMYALDCVQHGNQRTRTYSYQPEEHLIELAQFIASRKLMKCGLCGYRQNIHTSQEECRNCGECEFVNIK